MIEPLFLAALAMAAVDSAAAPPDTSAAPPSRVVRRLEEVVVRASPLHDILSSQAVQLVTRENLRALPVDRLTDALALKAGVVAEGEDLHVRGGRTGETQILLRGVALNDPWRGRPMELPLLALESAELVSGGLDPEYGGALAGVVALRTMAPGERWSADSRLESDGGLPASRTHPTGYDRIAARIGGPLVAGLGAVVAADVRTDDTQVPALNERGETRDRRSWKADNHILGLLKLAPLRGDAFALELIGSRRVTRPYDPMWSLDGYTTPCSGPFCSDGPAFSPNPLPGYERFRGADHAVMTDEHRYAAVMSGSRPVGVARARASVGWTRMRRVTSVGGQDDEWYLTRLQGPVFGIPDSPVSDPFYVYSGYEPFFQRATSEVWSLRGDVDSALPNGSRWGFGAGASYDHVAMREFDYSSPLSGLDSLRLYQAWAPGGFAYGQGRWIHEGMVLNGGLRLEAFTAGPQAEDQSFGAPARTLWSLAPRAGIAFPTSTRDVMSFSYVRIEQPPPRDFLYENRSNISNRLPLGNPSLETQTVISYQAALKHLFDRGRAVQLGFFFRDLFGQIGARAFEIRPGVFRRRFENADEGHAEGFEVSLIQPTGMLGLFEVHYTFMRADGTQSHAEGFPYGGKLQRRIDPIGDMPLDWDRRHSVAVVGAWRRPLGPAAPVHGPIELALRSLRGSWSVAWATHVGSPLPWTPSQRNEDQTDPALVNTRRFKWEENTSVALRWSPALLGQRVGFGLDVRNLFDFRGERAATIDGYPHPTINTVYDDDGAFREETGLPGGAFWDGDRDPGAPTAWVRIHDPRLLNAPRAVRLSVDARW